MLETLSWLFRTLKTRNTIPVPGVTKSLAPSRSMWIVEVVNFQWFLSVCRSCGHDEPRASMVHLGSKSSRGLLGSSGRDSAALWPSPRAGGRCASAGVAGPECRAVRLARLGAGGAVHQDRVCGHNAWP